MDSKGGFAPQLVDFLCWLVVGDGLVGDFGTNVGVDCMDSPPSRRTDGARARCVPPKSQISNSSEEGHRYAFLFFFSFFGGVGGGGVISSNRWLQTVLVWVCVQQQINTFIWNKQPFAMLGSFLFFYFWGNSLVFQLLEFIPEGDFLFL